MKNSRGCNNQPLTGKQQRLAVAGIKSKRTVAGNGRQKGAVAIDKSVDACTTARDDESRKQMTEQTEDDQAGMDSTTNH